MKIEYTQFGDIVLEAEDDRDMLWLKKFVSCNAQFFKHIKDCFITVEGRSEYRNNYNTNDFVISDSIDDESGDCWIDPLKITINAFSEMAASDDTLATAKDFAEQLNAHKITGKEEKKILDEAIKVVQDSIKKYLKNN